MADFIRKRSVREVISHSLFFCFEGEQGCGYEFDCDPWGLVKDPDHPSYQACLTGEVDGRKVQAPELRHWTSREVTPAAVRCHCGAEHELVNSNGMGDSQCPKCGQWRNSCGQCLIDPEGWGEETGETFDSSGHYVHGDFHDYGPEGA